MISGVIRGLVGSKPDYKVLKNKAKDGGPLEVCQFSTCVNHQWRGEKKETWYQVNLYGYFARLAEQTIEVGQMVAVSGNCLTEAWDNGEKSGINRIIQADWFGIIPKLTNNPDDSDGGKNG